MINKQRLIKLTQKVISFDSQNPPGNEYALGQFIEKDMRALGLDVKIYTYAKRRPNIVATLRGTLPRAQAARDAILITPHYDTVPFGQGWKFTPLSGKIHQGKIFGRGASDDKGNLAGCMEVMRSFVEDKVRLRKDVIMAATADEETGSHQGIVPLLKQRILKPKLGMIMDSDELDTIVAQKGLIHSRIQIFGKKAHGAYNWRGVNAIEQAAEIIELLKGIKWKFKKHAMLHPPMMNIGVIRGGDKVNMVSDFCEFALDTRFLPGMTPEYVLKQIHQTIRKVTNKYKVIIDDLQLPYEIDPQHVFVQTYLKAALKLRLKATLKGSEGATVISFFKKYGIPAFATGFGSRGTAHTTDEYIKIDTLCKGTKLLEAYIKEYDRL